MTYSEYLMYGEEEVKSASSLSLMEEMGFKDLEKEEPEEAVIIPFSEGSEEEDPEDQDLPFPEEEDPEDQEPIFLKKLRSLQSELAVKLSFNDKAVYSLDSAFSMIYTVFKHTFELDNYRYPDVLVDVNRSYIEQLTGTINCLYCLKFLAFKDKQYALDELNSYKVAFAGYVNSLSH